MLTQVHMSRIKIHSATQQTDPAHEIVESDRMLTHLVRTDGQFLNKNYSPGTKSIDHPSIVNNLMSDIYRRPILS